MFVEEGMRTRSQSSQDSDTRFLIMHTNSNMSYRVKDRVHNLLAITLHHQRCFFIHPGQLEIIKNAPQCCCDWHCQANHALAPFNLVGIRIPDDTSQNSPHLRHVKHPFHVDLDRFTILLGPC